MLSRKRNGYMVVMMAWRFMIYIGGKEIIDTQREVPNSQKRSRESNVKRDERYVVGS
jgi:hypothetical protein